jgi:conjugative transposon TraM protein
MADSTAVLTTGHLSNYATNGFFGLDDSPVEQVDGNAIEAIVHDTQEIVDGSTIKIRLMQAIAIDGAAIQKDQFVYGRCSIKGERLTIEINSVRTGDALFPVTLMAYDLDGLEGIYIPGAIARDAAKQASDNALQNIQVMSLDPSIGAQAAAAGLEATKGLFSKKAKQVKVKVKAGYHILLKNANASTI